MTSQLYINDQLVPTEAHPFMTCYRVAEITTADGLTYKQNFVVSNKYMCSKCDMHGMAWGTCCFLPKTAPDVPVPLDTFTINLFGRKILARKHKFIPNALSVVALSIQASTKYDQTLRDGQVPYCLHGRDFGVCCTFDYLPEEELIPTSTAPPAQAKSEPIAPVPNSVEPISNGNSLPSGCPVAPDALIEPLLGKLSTILQTTINNLPLQTKLEVHQGLILCYLLKDIVAFEDLGSFLAFQLRNDKDAWDSTLEFILELSDQLVEDPRIFTEKTLHDFLALVYPHDQLPAPDQEMSLIGPPKPARKTRKFQKKHSPDHIPRPPNSYMIYSRWDLTSVKARHKQAARFKALSPNENFVWLYLEKLALRKHMEDYPGWVYSPVR